MSWNQKPLEEVADFCLGKMLDQNKNKGELLPYLANVNVRWGKFDLDDLREMRFEPGELERYGLKAGDIVMCEGGEPGRCALWKDHVPNMMIQKALHRIRPHDVLDSRFLFYSFLKKGRNNEFAGLFTGATIKHLPREKLAKVIIHFPDLAVQKRIADILSAYDDLIENNRRRIGLLEEAARLLYREWFVHFRFPGHEHVKILDGIPNSWRQGKVCDFYNTGSGGTPSRKVTKYFEPEIPWVKTQELANEFIIGTDEGISEEAVRHSSAKVFPSRTVLMAMYGATVGELGILAMPGACNQACCAVIPRDKDAHFIHAFLFFRENKERLRALSAGSAQRNISQDVIRAFPMLFPTSTLLKSFVEALSPSFDLRLNLQQQNRQLIVARDLFLQRLMKGEIAV